MFIIFGTLIVRAVRPLAKDHQELVSVEPEETRQHSVRRAGVWATAPRRFENSFSSFDSSALTIHTASSEQHARHSQPDLSLGLFVSGQFLSPQSEAFQRVPMLHLGLCKQFMSYECFTSL